MSNNFKDVQDAIAGIEWNDEAPAQYASALYGLSKQQRELILSTRGLSEENEGLVRAELEKIRAVQISNAATNAGIEGSQKKILIDELSLSSVDNLTKAKIKEAAATAGLTDEQRKQITATLLGKAATDQMSLSFATLKANAIAAGKAMIMNPMFLVSLIPIIVQIGKAIYDRVVVTVEEAKEKVDELHSAFEETARELERVNSELGTSKKRLEELRALELDGTITLVEQEELDKLREEIELLERRAYYLDEQAKSDAEETYKGLKNVYDMDRFSTTFNPLEIDFPDIATYYAEHKDEIEAYRRMLDGMGSSWDNMSEAEQKAAKSASEAYQSMLVDAGRVARTNLTWEEHIVQLSDNYEKLRKR